jgi:hypothetical protein
LGNKNKWILLKYQIFEPTKTFILNTRLISCLLKLLNLSICSHASNKKSMRQVLKQILELKFLNKDFCYNEIVSNY